MSFWFFDMCELFELFFEYLFINIVFGVFLGFFNMIIMIGFC